MPPPILKPHLFSSLSNNVVNNDHHDDDNDDHHDDNNDDHHDDNNDELSTLCNVIGMERHSIAVPGWWLNAWFDPIGLQSGCNPSAINLNLIRNQDAINLWMHRIRIWKRCFHLCSFFVLKLDWPEVWFYCNSSSANNWVTVCLVKWQRKSK